MEGNSCVLIESLIAEFKKGVTLIDQLSDQDYAAIPGDNGNIGAHFRHNLDFGISLLKGIESGDLDYGNRERDLQVESDRIYAIARFEALIEACSKIQKSKLNNPLRVRSEVDESLWVGSTVLRELEFVHSHTVHHYALISAKLKGLGIELSEEFGVAPSTLKYWNSGKTDSAAA